MYDARRGHALRLFQTTPPPYDPLDWATRPLAERGRMVCEAWAMQGYGTPLGIYAFHLVKVVVYVGAWIAFCSLSPGLGGLSSIGDWWLEPLAFEKAILWSMLFEGLGLGCGSGPLTGRYFPPLGGFLYFLRPGTTKLSLFPRLPLLGGSRRTWIDVALYLALVILLVRALVAPAIDGRLLVALAVLVPIIGIADRTVFLALRAEHYWTTIMCLAFAGNWIAGAKAVQLALWFWAGFSKLNHHFPTVVCVMTSNSPLARFAWLRRLMYRDYPGDLRPSRVAVAMGHAGTALELSVPLVFLFAPGGPWMVVGLIMMLMLHGYITSNVPMGVPIEWNIMVVYGGFALFWAHPDVTVLQLGSAPLAAFLAVMLIAVPLAGNLFPGRLSFLMSMRYYAGNWAYGVWLFRGESYRKLDRLVKSSAWVYDQLDRFYDRATSVGLVGKVLAFRLMHLHGRALPCLIPRAVDRLADYEYLDGEIVAGLALGWNFGDGHLHSEALLRTVQEQCGFDDGELRCIFVEAQPLGRSTLAYRIHDARTGLLDRGELDVRAMRERQPWSAA
ncbi:MAG TPA: DUF3556 domain-containing protein [Kofleriaceae bacterium]|nr:DUF3556 domain-containing protein [Kofleriaceae bacterium]